MKKCVAAVVWLSLLSLGHSAPLGSCDRLVEPITISNEELLGRWLYVGGSSDLPGSRSLGHLITSDQMDVTATSQSNILNLIQTQRIYGTQNCSSLTYNVTFENNTLLIEKPFYLREVYLTTDCSDCLVIHEEVVSGKHTFTSLMLFSRRRSVSPDVVEMLKAQADCLRMPSPIMMDTDYEICPDNISPSEGISALNSINSFLEFKMGLRVARFLDALFDRFVN
ncbi:uncharacterized protein LOC115007411 [Cottoperca gobio]|uniref:Uncharacterized protein LOC115007411 n=1 Tax=Cottoperca gobio TaxID=56716 RepID=A0A6J2PLY1_COTGO|nr:uncharacterized protein LOC115007411 [Cottoperca gobio]